MGEAVFNEGYKNLWNWLIRKDSLEITVPVEEAGSGIESVDYELIPEDGSTTAGRTSVKKGFRREQCRLYGGNLCQPGL